MDVRSILNSPSSRIRDSFSQGVSTWNFSSLKTESTNASFGADQARAPSTQVRAMFAIDLVTTLNVLGSFGRPPGAQSQTLIAVNRENAIFCRENPRTGRRISPERVRNACRIGRESRLWWPPDIDGGHSKALCVLPRTHALVGLSIRKMRDRKFSRKRKNARPRSRAGENRRVLKRAETCVSLPISRLSAGSTSA